MIEVAGQGYDMIVIAQSGHFDLSVSAPNVEAVMITAEYGVTVTGNALGNDIYGRDDANALDQFSGGAGNDSLFGLAGNDYLTGGAGNDVIDGGDGTFDTAYYFDATSGVVIDLAAGEASNDGHGGADTLVGIEVVHGSDFDDAISGNGAQNFLQGGEGDDTLAGAGGDDYLSGGAGADAYGGGAGFDIASVSVDFNSPQGAVVDLATGQASGAAAGDTFVSIEGLYGTAAGDTLTGNGGDNLLGGDWGDDALAGAGGDDELVGGLGADAINGGGGSDWAIYNDLTGDNVVDLLTGTGSGSYEAAGDTLISIENLQGAYFSDTLKGNDGVNVLLGGQGDDTLRGEVGADVLTGGIGADRFLFKAVEESEAGGLRDRITDFSNAEGDTLRLDAIDANTGAAGNQAFAFIGGAAFSDTAGELRFAQVAGNTSVFADVDGDGAADLSFRLDGLLTLVQSDFVL